MITVVLLLALVYVASIDPFNPNKMFKDTYLEDISDTIK